MKTDKNVKCWERNENIINDTPDCISYHKLLQQNLTKTHKPYNKIAEEQQNKRQNISLELLIEHQSSC